MKKKRIFCLIPLAGMLLSGCSFADGWNWFNKSVYTPVASFFKDLFGIKDKGEEEEGGKEEKHDETLYDVVLDEFGAITEKEEGILYQTSIDEVTFDLLGYSTEGGKLGSIKKASYNGVEYNGMIYNRSMIPGIEKIRVDFSGGDLHYVFTEYLMQDMNFDSKKNNKFENGFPVEVPADAQYFVIYNKSTKPVNIDAIKIQFFENYQFDSGLLYNKDSELGNARSMAKSYEKYNDYLEIENNPTATTNNYSVGKHDGHANNDSWYRWNGKIFKQSADLGTEFSFGMTVGGEYSRMVDEEKIFHYAVWPQFGWVDENNTNHASSNTYVQTYIGNDNYEPLGAAHKVHEEDVYADYSYEGRFFGDYGFISFNSYGVYSYYTWDYYKVEGAVVEFETEEEAKAYITTNLNGDFNHYEACEYGTWQFLDPNTHLALDGETSFREAYKAFNMPFWFIQFDVYLDNEGYPQCDVSINGFKLFTQDIFGIDYDTVNKPSLMLNSVHMHVVNYGNPDGSPRESYTGTFTYPRVID